MSIFAASPAVGEDLHTSPTVEIPKIRERCEIPWCIDDDFNPSDPAWGWTHVHNSTHKSLDTETTSHFDVESGGGSQTIKNEPIESWIQRLDYDNPNDPVTNEPHIVIYGAHEVDLKPADAIRFANQLIQQARIADPAVDDGDMVIDWSKPVPQPRKGEYAKCYELGRQAGQLGMAELAKSMYDGGFDDCRRTYGRILQEHLAGHVVRPTIRTRVRRILAAVGVR